MTTIATDGNTMAGDGQREHCGTIVDLDAEKVRRLPDGRIIGTSGHVAFGQQVIEWLSGNREQPVAPPDCAFGALILSPGGDVDLMAQDCVLIHVPPPCAIGSGMDVALGAMEAGATPKKAVEAASRRDANTGGTITVLSRNIREADAA